jgi:hypothetical protein
MVFIQVVHVAIYHLILLINSISLCKYDFICRLFLQQIGGRGVLLNPCLTKRLKNLSRAGETKMMVCVAAKTRGLSQGTKI